jgi:hypothetical protein
MNFGTGRLNQMRLKSRKEIGGIHRGWNHLPIRQRSNIGCVVARPVPSPSKGLLQWTMPIAEPC